MIISGDITSISSERLNANLGNNGMDININFDSFLPSEDGKGFELGFAWSLKYSDGAGYMTMKGKLVGREDAAAVKAMAKSWKEKKTLPDSTIAEAMMNINHLCQADGVLVAKVLKFVPPIPPMGVSLKKGGT